MKETTIKPWEMGEEKKGFPEICESEHILVRLAPPKSTGSIRSGIVGTFLMTSFVNTTGEIVETIKTSESVDGFKIEFPMGKRGLLSTKFRGAKNYYRFLNRETKQFYEIPQEKFSVEFAESYLSSDKEGKVDNWENLSQVEKDAHIDKYLEDMFMYGLSQDLMLPIVDDKFTAPFVGLKTKLYRVVRPRKPGEQYDNTIITKWNKGLPELSGDYTTVSEELAKAIFEEWQFKETVKEDDKFDPTTFDESVDEDVI